MSRTMLSHYQNVQDKKRPHKPKPPKHPKPPVTPKPDFKLTLDHCAFINTKAIPLNDKVLVNIPGCTTITLHESYLSPEAQTVWKANQGDNPFFAPTPPTNPKACGLMVIRDPLDRVEAMIPYLKQSQFKMIDKTHAVGAEFFITCDTKVGSKIIPLGYMNVRSPTTYAIIPGIVFGGEVECVPPHVAPKP